MAFTCFPLSLTEKPSLTHILSISLGLIRSPLRAHGTVAASLQERFPGCPRSPLETRNLRQVLPVDRLTPRIPIHPIRAPLGPGYGPRQGPPPSAPQQE